MRNLALVTTTTDKKNRFIDYLSFLDRIYHTKKIELQDNGEEKDIKTDAKLTIVDLNVLYDKGNYYSIERLLENTTSKIVIIDIHEKRLMPPYFVRYLLDYATENGVDAAYFMFDKVPIPLFSDEAKFESAKNKFKEDIGNFIEIMLQHNDTDSMHKEAVDKIPYTHFQFSNYKHKI